MNSKLEIKKFRDFRLNTRHYYGQKKRAYIILDSYC